MKQSDLASLIKTNNDKIAMKAINGDEEIVTLNIWKMKVCELLEGCEFSMDNKAIVKQTTLNHIETMSDNDFGTLITMMALNNVLYDSSRHAVYDRMEDFILYFLIKDGNMTREKFLGALPYLCNVLDVSKDFYDGLVSYYGSKKDLLANSIIQRLKTNW